MSIYLIDINELSKQLGISKQTLFNWRSQHKIPFVKVGRCLRFNPREIERWLEARTFREKDHNTRIGDILFRNTRNRIKDG